MKPGYFKRLTVFGLTVVAATFLQAGWLGFLIYMAFAFPAWMLFEHWFDEAGD